MFLRFRDRIGDETSATKHRALRQAFGPNGGYLDLVLLATQVIVIQSKYFLGSSVSKGVGPPK